MNSNKFSDLRIEPASQKMHKIKIGLAGASGGGKTMSALKIAYGLCQDWRKICVIDTENSAGLYKRLGDYFQISLKEPYSSERYIEAFNLARNAGFEVIIIDSVSHFWSGAGGVLDANQLIEQDYFKGNSFRAWQMTNKLYYYPFIQRTIYQDDAHVIFTIRSKAKHIVQTEGGRQKIQKVGSKYDMRDGFDYELTVVFEMESGGVATATKDRTSLFLTEKFRVSEETGAALRGWLESFAGDGEVPLTDSAAKEVSGGKLLYYLPILKKVDTKLYERALYLIDTGKEDGVNKALEFIKKEEAKINKAVEECFLELAAAVEREANNEQKLILLESAAPIIKAYPKYGELLESIRNA